MKEPMLRELTQKLGQGWDQHPALLPRFCPVLWKAALCFLPSPWPPPPKPTLCLRFVSGPHEEKLWVHVGIDDFLCRHSAHSEDLRKGAWGGHRLTQGKAEGRIAGPVWPVGCWPVLGARDAGVTPTQIFSPFGPYVTVGEAGT